MLNSLQIRDCCHRPQQFVDDGGGLFAPLLHYWYSYKPQAVLDGGQPRLAGALTAPSRGLGGMIAAKHTRRVLLVNRWEKITAGLLSSQMVVPPGNQCNAPPCLDSDGYILPL